MNMNERRRRADIRIWIVAAEAWEPASVFDEPPASVALFPALDRGLTRREATEFVMGFNEQMLQRGGRRWAVARRVAARADEVALPPVKLGRDMGAGLEFATSGSRAGRRADRMSAGRGQAST
jgi:hypothetical protein